MKIPLSILIVLSFSVSMCFAQSNFNTDKFQYLSPVPGSSLVRPETNIIIRFGEAFQNIILTDSTILTVEGTLSGIHTGEIFFTDDLYSLVFQPVVPFSTGENVSVILRSGLKTVSGKEIDSLKFNFTITNGCPTLGKSTIGEINYPISKISDAINITNKSSADSTLIYPPDFPRITFSNKTNPEAGNYFLALTQDANNYLTIINNNGVPIYYRKETTPIYDFKIQPSGILTYYLSGRRKFIGLDSLYTVVDSFYTGNGLLTDFHDLQVLPNGNAYLIAYDKEPVQMDTVNNWNNISCVEGCVIQEINKQKKVIWQWRTWDHYKITDADPTIVDLNQQSISYCHINSIDIVDDTTMVISTKHFDEVTAINRITGNIMWRFGGKKNQFLVDGGTPDFIYQHDARYLGNNTLSLFDNGSAFTRPASRGLIYRIDTQNKVGTLVKNLVDSPVLFGFNMGNLQITPNGNIIIGWGNIGGNQYKFTEYDSTGVIVNDATLTNSVLFYSYRAFKFPWETKLITTDQDSVIFENVQPNNSSQRFLKVFNNSNVPINISGVFNSDTSFNVLQNFPALIPANSNMNFNIEFKAINSNETIDTIYIVSKDSIQMVAKQVVLIGNPKTTAVENDNSNKILSYQLYQNYPNPFNPSTTITYVIPAESFVTLKIYDVLGRLVQTLINENKQKGKHIVLFNALNFSNGIYFYKLSAGNYTKVKKMVLLK